MNNNNIMEEEIKGRGEKEEEDDEKSKDSLLLVRPRSKRANSNTTNNRDALLFVKNQEQKSSRLRNASFRMIDTHLYFTLEQFDRIDRYLMLKKLKKENEARARSMSDSSVNETQVVKLVRRKNPYIFGIRPSVFIMRLLDFNFFVLF